MTGKEKNINYTARDIQQYLAGNLSPQQMHAIEKAALDDPFLAEAMEGYEVVKDIEWNNELVALREEIKSKGAVAKVIPLHKSKNNRWKIAAAVLIIGSFATFTFILKRNKNEQSGKAYIAQTVPSINDSFTQIEIPSPGSVTQSLNPNASASTEEKNAIPGTLAQVQNVNDKTKNYIIAEPGAPVLKPAAPVASETINSNEKAIVTAPSANNSTTDESAELLKDINAEKSKATAKQNNEAEVQAILSQKNQGAAIAKKEGLLNNFFTAQVVAADNTPLPFTNISIKKDNFGTYADANGVVRLVSTDSILNVEVKSVGYLPAIFTLRNNQVQSKIILHEDEMAFKDKTVILKSGKALTQRSRRATLSSDTAVNVEPADGWNNYNTYVANNLDIPESLLSSNLHGEVELSFDVKANGTISNIKVNKSMGAQYDEAAKRLIQEGPQWKVKKGKKTSASIKVQF